MSNNPVFITLLSALTLAGGYGVYTIIQKDSVNNSDTSIHDAPINSTSNIDDISSNIAKTETSSDTNKQIKTSGLSDYQRIMTETVGLLKNNQYRIAVELVDSHYQQLSVQQLEQFESLFIKSALQLRQSNKSLQAIDLLTSYNQVFNGLDGWTLLSNLYLENQGWQAGINTLLKAASLEYQPDKLEALMTKLESAASFQRALLETQNDELGINSLYKKLYEIHPENGRFQLELASSHLRLGDVNTARNLLEPLQYDVEYGAIAKAVLSKLQNDTIVAIEEPVKKSTSRNEIVVPLLRSGNSFFANTVINNRELRLLLDTGASITALSQQTIDSLNLTPTGRSIQLSTANGVTQSRLYHADQITLGGLTIKNLVVAEIAFDKNSQIHGLLGTDLLNQLDNRYSYVIDNQRNALIFKSKN